MRKYMKILLNCQNKFVIYMRIGIISRTDKEEAIELDDTIIKYLFENNIEV